MEKVFSVLLFPFKAIVLIVRFVILGLALILYHAIGIDIGEEEE